MGDADHNDEESKIYCIPCRDIPSYRDAAHVLNGCS
jgi:hypothetical protein